MRLPCLDVNSGRSVKGIALNLPEERKIRLKENAVPVIHPARKVPITLKKRLRVKLDALIKEKSN